MKNLALWRFLIRFNDDTWYWLTLVWATLYIQYIKQVLAVFKTGKIAIKPCSVYCIHCSCLQQLIKREHGDLNENKSYSITTPHVAFKNICQQSWVLLDYGVPYGWKVKLNHYGKAVHFSDNCTNQVHDCVEIQHVLATLNFSKISAACCPWLLFGNGTVLTQCSITIGDHLEHQHYNNH